MKLFEKNNSTALNAIEEAQRIAFAPMVFQAARLLRNTGILALIEKRNEGLFIEEIYTELGLSNYAIRVLVEMGLGANLLVKKDEKYFVTKTGFFILHDEMTRVNMDFIHDVCYKGMFYLEESIASGKPEGLKVFGEWETIYEGLSKLSEEVQKSWFAFDHFYSDNTFSKALPLVFESKPKRILDIGGNTGKWALQCLNFDKEIQLGILDLPGQVPMAKLKIDAAGFANRISYHECNLLSEMATVPLGYDVIWMSQFLDCFSDQQIVSILTLCKNALGDGGHIFILEPFWDRQQFEASAFSLQATSLYFTALANGNSQMYHSEIFKKFIDNAGLQIIQQWDGLGVSHTLLKCGLK